ncbi:DUF1851 domain-containing protein [Paracoccus sp. 11-3]|uniref:DUF1851 domain-containing protein n=1 Tax=Paracoccus amoyensis TaxID=2760093 RepID=A0A926G5V6_9RHOB|nr:T6SS immunity protein Tdi1 domain-containing protein [Paracoccus amoyensis]MBC9245133.1 DUF1851 domain-containing protein [Paracoccus amoyensis]
MSKISEDYEYYVEKSHPVVFPGDLVDWEKYGKEYLIPPDAVSFLMQYQCFSAYDGRLLVGDPGVFSGILPLIFQGDPDFHHRDTIVVGHSAFGRLYCWSSRYGGIDINLINATMACNGFIRPESFMKRPEINFSSLIDSMDPDVFDEEDEYGVLLFKRAKRKLGPLGYRECYGFRLALPMGGYRTLDKLEKLPAPEHYSFLAQLQPFTLIDWGTTSNFGLREIRQVG